MRGACVVTLPVDTQTNIPGRWTERPNLSYLTGKCSPWKTCVGFPGGASGKEPTSQCRRQGTGVWSLSLEDTLGKGTATHSSLAWRIPWTEEPGGLQFTGLQRVGVDWATEHSLRWWLSGEEPACQCRRPQGQKLHPWVGKIPLRRK